MKYVLYHSNCYDGFGAAFAAWKAFGDTAKYVAVNHGKPPPETPGATEIFIVDFSYPLDTIWALHERAPVTVLDHHKTAKAELETLSHREDVGPRVLFDMTRSGAKITWEYLHRTPAPPLIEHISDRDLWAFKMEGASAVHKALVSLPFDFKVWDALDVEKLKVDGALLERMYAELVSQTCNGAYTAKIDGHAVPVVNTSIAWSEVGHELLERNPAAPFVASFTVFGTEVMYSLRSRPGFDVSAIAKKFGGGGHENAAGFKVPKA